MSLDRFPADAKESAGLAVGTHALDSVQKDPPGDPVCCKVLFS